MHLLQGLAADGFAGNLKPGDQSNQIQEEPRSRPDLKLI
jgi:hypothetical protein